MNKLRITLILIFIFNSLGLWSQNKENYNDVISQIDLDNKESLDFLHNQLGDKRIVFLGEVNHITTEFNKIKGAIIKHLIEKENFDVVLFESPFYTLYVANKNKEFITADSIMKSSIFRVWHTQENLELIEYIKNNKKVDLMGIDMHGRSKIFTNYLYDLLLKNKIDIADQFKVNDSLLTYYEYKYASANGLHRIKEIYKTKEKYTQFYQTLINNLNKLSSIDSLEKVILKRCIQNRISLVDMLCYSGVTSNKTQQIRESFMADNLVFLTDTLFKNRKIIVWAHNEHIQKGNRQKYKNCSSMGNRFNKNHDSISYYIGLFAPLNKKNTKGELYYNFNNCKYPMFYLPLTDKVCDKYPLLKNKGSLEKYLGGLIKNKRNLSEEYNAIIFSKTRTNNFHN